MIKLVLEYSDGDESCSCDYIHCFEYESKEKFLFDFELEATNQYEKREEIQKKYDAWKAKNPVFDGRVSPKKQTEAREAWLQENPGYPMGEFEFIGHQFNWRTIFYFDEKEKKLLFIQPYVYELEEWFQNKLMEN